MTEIPSYPELSGDLVILRPFRLEDAAHIAQSCEDSDIPRFTLMPEEMTEADAQRYIERRHQQWDRGAQMTLAITSHSSDQCLGQVGVFFETRLRRAETFYWLDARARGQGLATEALGLVTMWAFDERGVVRVQLITHLDNPASQAVAQRCGYAKEGVLRAWEPIKDTQPDVVMWSRLATD